LIGGRQWGSPRRKLQGKQKEESGAGVGLVEKDVAPIFWMGENRTDVVGTGVKGPGGLRGLKREVVSLRAILLYGLE